MGVSPYVIPGLKDDIGRFDGVYMRFLKLLEEKMDFMADTKSTMNFASVVNIVSDFYKW